MLFFKKIKLPDLKDIPVILLLGLLGFTVYHMCLSLGEQTVSAGAASLLVSTTPIFSAFFGSLFLKERMNQWRWIGSFVAFSGVAVISLGSGNVHSVFTIGVIWMLIAAVGESLCFVFETNYLKKYGFIHFNVYTIIAGTLWMLFFIPGLGAEIEQAFLSSILAVIYLGLMQRSSRILPWVMSYRKQGRPKQRVLFT